jgi:hypothetical protein
MNSHEKNHSDNIANGLEKLRRVRAMKSSNVALTVSEEALWKGWRDHKNLDIEKRVDANLLRIDELGLTLDLVPEATIKNMVSNLFRMDGVLESHPDETLYHLIIESRQLGAYGCKTVNGPSFEPFRWLVEKQDVHLPPVFTKMDGSYFNIHELKGDLGFQVQCVYSSRLCINARHFENHIHTVLNDLLDKT